LVSPCWVGVTGWNNTARGRERHPFLLSRQPDRPPPTSALAPQHRIARPSADFRVLLGAGPRPGQGFPPPGGMGPKGARVPGEGKTNFRQKVKARAEAPEPLLTLCGLSARRIGPGLAFCLLSKPQAR
jgi:hypothetical protein